MKKSFMIRPSSILETSLYILKIKDTVNQIHSIPIYPFNT